MTDYQKQAQDFMDKTGTTMTAHKLGHFPYFDDDKKPRDVYEITLTRQNKPGDFKPVKSYKFRYGQSIAESGKKTPTPYDVLACLTKSDPGTFRDFCADFGYDEDSRKAEKVYFDVQEEYRNVMRLFGDVIEELQEIT